MKISLNNITKQYQDLVVLDEFNLDLSFGQMISIIGPSGSGKTTLLSILGTINLPDSGKIIVDGRDVINYNSDQMQLFRAEYISYIFQEYNLLENLTLLENMQIVSDSSIREIKRVLDQFGIGHLINQRPNSLSGGECQRAAIARAILRKSKIIFADEPTGALDHKNRKIVIDHLKRVSEQGIKVIMVTHDIDCTLSSDRIIIFHQGKVKRDIGHVANITKEQLYSYMRGESDENEN